MTKVIKVAKRDDIDVDDYRKRQMGHVNMPLWRVVFGRLEFDHYDWYVFATTVERAIELARDWYDRCEDEMSHPPYIQSITQVTDDIEIDDGFQYITVSEHAALRQELRRRRKNVD